ncbi:HAD hydrolase-like protein [Clostridium sp. 19966]|uniref:HAD family hydrolase n=1 Tax=Clostridium sp. 19966 TaxID=2768166 RepID=UPI0028DE0815|nr:HAD family hydrolase [Clostridium sp. 19966]MDT8717784.1 HAD hydrolase-like protein [Clostridium sp. 19966]
MYRNFVFDLYGTLINIHTNEEKSIVWKKLSLFYSYNGANYKPNELKYLGIHDYFDGLYSSSDIEICKPDKTFFNYLVKSEHLIKEESVFIGNDHICDVEGAKAASLDCLYIHSNQSRKITEVTSKYAIWDGDISKILSILS